MLWTAKGMWLLFVLGVIAGGGAVGWYVTEPSGKAVAWGLAAIAAFLGALWLIIQYMGPAGGGG